jgi:hypothetical protein
MTTQWAQQLSQFSGTEHYYRIMPTVLMTDGAKFVADNGEAYWLMTAIASYLPQFKNTEPFIVADLQVSNTENSRTALLKLEDGNENILVEQHIAYTDFELNEIKFYACDTGDAWVIMLPREY